MKKLVLLLIVVLIYSCNNEDEFIQQLDEKGNIENASLDKQVAYTHENLLNVGMVISKLYQKQNFKNLLFDEINKNVINNDVDYEISAIDLLEKMDLNKLNINTKDTQILIKSIEAFENLDGEDWMPTISIYNFEKNYDKIKNRTVFDPAKPVIVTSVLDEPDPDGFQESDDGILEKLDFKITENVATNLNDLVILRLTPTCIDINDIGYNIKTPIPEPGEEPLVTKSCAGGGSPPPASTVDYLRLGDMIVKYHKESWHNGRSELHFRGFWDRDFLPNDINYPGEFFTFYNNDAYGKRMKRFRRRWIRHHNTKTLNSRLFWDIDNMLALGGRNYLGYVIFEYDPWPAGKKTAHLPSLPSGQLRTIKYRSNQSYYNRDWVEVSNFSQKNYDNAFTHHPINNSIEYNFYRDIN